MSKQQKSIDALTQVELVPEEDRPYELPANWFWVKSGSILNFVGGGTPAKDNNGYWNGDIPWATVKDIKKDYLSSTVDQITNQGLENSSATLAKPNELLLVTRMSPGKSTITEISTAINQDLKIIRPKFEIPSYFLRLFFELKTPLIESISTGSTVKGIQVAKLKELAFPFPPLAEQKRISEKVENLFSKIDKAEQLIEESKKSFKIRRASILDKAFCGELTSEWRNNNNSLSLVDEWVREMKIVKEEKRKDKFKDQLNSSVLDELYELPKEWRWVRLNDLIDQSTYGTSSKTNDNKSGKPVLRMGNIIDGCFDLNNLKYLNNENEDVLKYDLEPNDLLFNRTNSYELVGKTSLITPEMSGKYAFASYLIRIRLLDKDVLASYIVHYINSHLGRGILLSMVSQQVGQANINSQKLASLPIPLPPKEEVIKITRVLDKYRSLEREQKKMMNIEEHIENLKKSILSKAFKGKLGTTIADEENIIKLLEKKL